ARARRARAGRGVAASRAAVVGVVALGRGGRLDAGPGRGGQEGGLLGRARRAVRLVDDALLACVRVVQVRDAALGLFDPRADRADVGGGGRDEGVVALPGARVGGPAALGNVDVVHVGRVGLGDLRGREAVLLVDMELHRGGVLLVGGAARLELTDPLR